MSNVLIGIIGVILFIGLALAGALFLGPRFQESAVSSTASAAIQMVTQVSHAAAMREMQTGVETKTEGRAGESLTADAYLKAVPYNPTMPGGLTGDASFPIRAVTENTAYGTVGQTVAKVMIMRIGDSRHPPQTICEHIQRGVGKSSIDIATGKVPDAPAGCFQAGTGMAGAVSANSYYAYARI
jgi:hypothetical protein